MKMISNLTLVVLFDIIYHSKLKTFLAGYGVKKLDTDDLTYITCHNS